MVTIAVKDTKSVLFLKLELFIFSHMIDYFSYINWHDFYLFSVSLWRRINARYARLYYPYRQYTNLFIFRFVSLLCLIMTLRLLKIDNNLNNRHFRFLRNSTWGSKILYPKQRKCVNFGAKRKLSLSFFTIMKRNDNSWNVYIYIS